MNSILESIFTRQAPTPGSSEGLPYWIFWLLLCVILLLLVFIFLRDKDLRRRINLFLFGAKKKLIKMRLQARLKRECRKKEDQTKELGKKIWDDKLEIINGNKTTQELEKLEKNKQDLDRESDDAQKRIDGLEADLDKFTQKHKDSVAEQESAKKPYQEKLTEIRDEERVLEVKVTEKQKELEGMARGLNSPGNETEDKREELSDKKEKMDEEIKKLVDERLDLEKVRKSHLEKIEEFDNNLKLIEEGGKKRIREFHKEIKEWKKAKEKLSEKIEHIEKKKEPLFLNLGKQADKAREHQEELTVFYSQIDRAKERIGDLERQIKNL
jgi:hypothetical protein